MNITEKIELTKKNIKKAIEDYWKHSELNDFIKADISEAFINRVASDAVYAKQDLRNMLRKSPAWNEELDALVINGNTTHNPNYDRVWRLGLEIMNAKFNNRLRFDERNNIVVDDETGEIVYKNANCIYGNTPEEYDIISALRYFALPNDESREIVFLEALKRLAPDAYVPGKKISRVFKGLCDALGVTDNTANSSFQRKFAQIADEMSSKQINYKLYVSINPAHFITMSNPKYDNRGDCMTSCHSFNSTDYNYNSGCVGYARDKVTMIAFTVSDDNNPETLNNRKTTRQLFMYQPDNGLLLQSRMYNTSGGTTGAQAESAVYRDLVQREISRCENAINSWKTFRHCDNKWDITIPTHHDFGGYADWEYHEFNAKLSVRKDHKDDFHIFTVGEAGCCVNCGRLTNYDDGLYCSRCDDSYDDDYDD